MMRNPSTRLAFRGSRSTDRSIYSRVTAGFTLVEMLVVITIMAVMLGIAIASFSGMGTGARITGAYNELSSAVRLAQMYAVGNSTKTYLVFYDVEEGGQEFEHVYGEPKDWYRYFRGFGVWSDAESKFVSDVKLLPPGLMFLPRDKIVGSISGVHATSREAECAIDNFSVQEGVQSAIKVKALAFLPDGQVTYDNGAGGSGASDVDPFLISFTEGITNADEKVGGVEDGTYKNIKLDNAPAPAGSGTMYVLRVNALSGSIDRLEIAR